MIPSFRKGKSKKRIYVREWVLWSVPFYNSFITLINYAKIVKNIIKEKKKKKPKTVLDPQSQMKECYTSVTELLKGDRAFFLKWDPTSYVRVRVWYPSLLLVPVSIIGKHGKQQEMAQGVASSTHTENLLQFWLLGI